VHEAPSDITINLVNYCTLQLLHTSPVLIITSTADAGSSSFPRGAPYCLRQLGARPGDRCDIRPSRI